MIMNDPHISTFSWWAVPCSHPNHHGSPTLSRSDSVLWFEFWRKITSSTSTTAMTATRDMRSCCNNPSTIHLEKENRSAMVSWTLGFWHQKEACAAANGQECYSGDPGNLPGRSCASACAPRMMRIWSEWWWYIMVMICDDMVSIVLTICYLPKLAAGSSRRMAGTFLPLSSVQYGQPFDLQQARIWIHLTCLCTAEYHALNLLVLQILIIKWRWCQQPDEEAPLLSGGGAAVSGRIWNCIQHKEPSDALLIPPVKKKNYSYLQGGGKLKISFRIFPSKTWWNGLLNERSVLNRSI